MTQSQPESAASLCPFCLNAFKPSTHANHTVPSHRQGSISQCLQSQMKMTCIYDTCTLPPMAVTPCLYQDLATFCTFGSELVTQPLPQAANLCPLESSNPLLTLAADTWPLCSVGKHRYEKAAERGLWRNMLQRERVAWHSCTMFP